MIGNVFTEMSMRRTPTTHQIVELLFFIIESAMVLPTTLMEIDSAVTVLSNKMKLAVSLNL